MDYQTSTDLYAALVIIGYGEDRSGIKPATIARLLEFGMLTQSRDGQIELTAAGDKAFSLIEGGDDVPEFGRADDIQPAPGCE